MKPLDLVAAAYGQVLESKHIFAVLQAEYDTLKLAHTEHSMETSAGYSSDADTNHDTEMIQEAKLLRQHKGRLEARMQILEDHNRQLEAQ